MLCSVLSALTHSGAADREEIILRTLIGIVFITLMIVLAAVVTGAVGRLHEKRKAEEQEKAAQNVALNGEQQKTEPSSENAERG